MLRHCYILIQVYVFPDYMSVKIFLSRDKHSNKNTKGQKFENALLEYKIRKLLTGFLSTMG